MPAPIYDHLIDHPVEAQLNTLSVRGSLKVCTFGLQTWDPETVSFYIGEKKRSRRIEYRREERGIESTTERSEELKVPPRRAKHHRRTESWIDETGRRSDPTENEYRSWSDAVGETLLLTAESK